MAGRLNFHQHSFSAFAKSSKSVKTSICFKDMRNSIHCFLWLLSESQSKSRIALERSKMKVSDSEEAPLVRNAMSFEEEAPNEQIRALQERFHDAQEARRRAEAAIENLRKQLRNALEEERHLEVELEKEWEMALGDNDDDYGCSDGEDEVELGKERIRKLQEKAEMIERQIAVQVGKVKRCDVPERCIGLNFLEKGDFRMDKALKVALASYPRSGNSLLRSLIERLTGVYTGSDTDPLRPLNFALVEAGMMGEGIVDERVFAVKTHFPERMGRCGFCAGKAILLIRNPFDAIVSYFNMILTQSHTQSILDEEFDKFRDIWMDFVGEEIEIWKQFHDHWLDKELRQRIPLCVVRYEDLIGHRHETLERVVDFLAQGPNQSEHRSKMQQQLEILIQANQQELGVYEPRCNSFGLTENFAAGSKQDMDIVREEDNSVKQGCMLPLRKELLKSLRLFTKTQVKQILSSAKSLLSQFGYWDAFFQHDHGPSYVNREPGKCIVVKFVSKDAPAGPFLAHLNRRYPLRPLTKDDPYARGFGKRWKRALTKLPPVKVREKGA